MSASRTETSLQVSQHVTNKENARSATTASTGNKKEIPREKTQSAQFQPMDTRTDGVSQTQEQPIVVDRPTEEQPTMQVSNEPNTLQLTAGSSFAPPPPRTINCRPNRPSSQTTSSVQSKADKARARAAKARKARAKEGR